MINRLLKLIHKILKPNKERTLIKPECEAILYEKINFYKKLPRDLKEKFNKYIQNFIELVPFEGRGGLEINYEIQVCIAASAVRLALHRDLTIFNRLKKIIVHPKSFIRLERDHLGNLIEDLDESNLIWTSGLAHSDGTVEISWDCFKNDLLNIHDAQDVVIHEFAHLIDLMDGKFDGNVNFNFLLNYKVWSKVLSHHFKRLEENKLPERKVLRSYGATNEVEFFAVATESFFERPKRMEKNTPELYQALCALYGFYPASDNQEGVPSGDIVKSNALCPCGSLKKYKRCCGKKSSNSSL